MCLFKKPKERYFFKNMAIGIASFAGVWSLVDFATQKTTDGAVKLLWMATTIANFALGYMTADLKEKPKCQLPHLPHDAVISAHERLEADVAAKVDAREIQRRKMALVLGHEHDREQPGTQVEGETEDFKGMPEPSPENRR